MRNGLQLCLAANNVLLMRKWKNAFLLQAIPFAWNGSFPKIFIENKLVDRMIKEL